MPETVAGEDVRDESYEELIEGLKEAFEDIKAGRTYSDNDAIRKRVEELRQQS